MAQITWICNKCGNKYGRRRCRLATWHEGVCDICGREVPVTEPRDFGGFRKVPKIEKPVCRRCGAVLDWQSDKYCRCCYEDLFE